MLLSIGMLMLSATQVYTILTVQLFAFLNLLPVEADILAYNFENASQTLMTFQHDLVIDFQLKV
ncbi:hypothetical protein DBR06_SOUSAS11510085 [Sousa chinensis]|uniref:Uncharacterized protein n=1 Tax=Sousa chinensis TaxID=103600 RepID=A0A484GKE0_SOUCH|nr:hypothetical protein DBR06_SOUSAS11510085 [Sousa chinensis]